MTHTELFEWQFANELQDEWWIAVAGKSGTRTYTLAEVKQLKENAPRSTIQLLHMCFAREENPEWAEYELERIEPVVIPPPLPMDDPSPKRPRFNSKVNKWNATLPQMMRLAAAAITDCGYTVTNANDTIGMISFETKMSWGSWSGISASIQVTEAEQCWFIVSGKGKQNVRGGQLVAFDLFGETDSVVNKVRQRMMQLAQ